MKLAVSSLAPGSRISDEAGLGLRWFRDRLSPKLVAGDTRYRPLGSMCKVDLKIMSSLTQHLDDVAPVTRRARPILQVVPDRGVIAMYVWRHQ